MSITGLTDDIRAAPVAAVFFHCSETGKASRRAAHWRLFFQLGGRYRGRSVEFNSQRLQEDMRTRLYVTYRQYQTSTRSREIGNTAVPVASGVTLGHVLALVLQNGRDRYTLNDGGSGCRYWCLTVLNDLELARYVNQGSGANVEAFIAQLYQTLGQTWIPYPLHQGTFY